LEAFIRQKVEGKKKEVLSALNGTERSVRFWAYAKGKMTRREDEVSARSWKEAQKEKKRERPSEQKRRGGKRVSFGA